MSKKQYLRIILLFFAELKYIFLFKSNVLYKTFGESWNLFFVQIQLPVGSLFLYKILLKNSLLLVGILSFYREMLQTFFCKSTSWLKVAAEVVVVFGEVFESWPRSWLKLSPYM